MGLSLREQLLNAGLIDEKKLKEAKQVQHHQRRDQAKRPPGAVDPRAEAAKKAAAEKAARDAELNRQKEEQAAKKARKAEVKQLVAQHKLAKVDSEELYNFIDGKRIRRLPVDKTLREKLIAGSVMIVRNEGRYEFVPADVAARIAERDVHAVVPNTKAEPAPEPAADDPYKDYVVPDDLMW